MYLLTSFRGNWGLLPKGAEQSPIFIKIIAPTTMTMKLDVLVHMISDTDSSLVIARHTSMSLRGVSTTKQSQSEIPRLRSEQELPRFARNDKEVFLSVINIQCVTYLSDLDHWIW